MKTSYAGINIAASIVGTAGLTARGGFPPPTLAGAEEGKVEGMTPKALVTTPPEAGGLIGEALTCLFRADDNSNFLSNAGSILPLRITTKTESEECSSYSCHYSLLHAP